jgi:hypothetical protein
MNKQAFLDGYMYKVAESLDSVNNLSYIDEAGTYNPKIFEYAVSGKVDGDRKALGKKVDKLLADAAAAKVIEPGDDLSGLIAHGGTYADKAKSLMLEGVSMEQAEALGKDNSGKGLKEYVLNQRILKDRNTAAKDRTNTYTALGAVGGAGLGGAAGGTLGYSLTSDKKNALRNTLLGILGGGVVGGVAGAYGGRELSKR